MPSNIKLITSIFLLFCNLSFASTDNCQQLDQAENMCKGYGFCTMYPLGKNDQPCGTNWTIPDGFKAMSKDCLKNQETKKTYSCKNGGKISSVICGKSNCYTCICD